MAEGAVRRSMNENGVESFEGVFELEDTGKPSYRWSGMDGAVEKSTEQYPLTSLLLSPNTTLNIINYNRPSTSAPKFLLKTI